MSRLKNSTKGKLKGGSSTTSYVVNSGPASNEELVPAGPATVATSTTTTTNIPPAQNAVPTSKDTLKSDPIPDGSIQKRSGRRGHTKPKGASEHTYIAQDTPRQTEIESIVSPKAVTSTHISTALVSSSQALEPAVISAEGTNMIKDAAPVKPIPKKDLIWRHLAPQLKTDKLLSNHSKTSQPCGISIGSATNPTSDSHNQSPSATIPGFASTVHSYNTEHTAKAPQRGKQASAFPKFNARTPPSEPENAASMQQERASKLIKEIESLARELSGSSHCDVQLPITPPPSPPTTSNEASAVVREVEGEIETPGVLSPPTRSFQDHLVLEGTNVRFGDGLAVEIVTTPFEPTRITVSGISPKLEWQDLRWYLQFFGVAIHSELRQEEQGSQGKIARIRFAHHKEAENAVRELDGRPGLATDLPLLAKYDTGLPANHASTNIVADRVIVRWKRPTSKLRLYYRSARVAREEVDVINRRTFCGHQLRATLRASQHIIIVEGLSQDSDLKEIKRRHHPDQEPTFLENHYDHVLVMDQMTTLFKKARTRNLEFKETDAEVAIYSNFCSQDDAEQFLRDFGQLDLPWRAPARLCVIHAWDLVYVMHVDKYVALRASIDDLAVKLQQAEIRLRVLTPPGHVNFRHIRIRGGHYVKAFKSMIDATLVGDVVTRDGKPLWDADLDYLYGPRLFSDLQIDGVVFVERRRQRMMLMCPEDRRAVSTRRIYHRFDTAKQRLHTHSFPRWQLRYFIDAVDYVIIPRFGPEDVLLDTRNCRIVVGGLLAVRSLKIIISKAPNARVLSQTAQHSNARCPVCLEAPSDPIELLCQHHFCTSCLTRYLLSAAQPEAVFPMQCFGNDGQCTLPVPLGVIRRLLTREKFELATSQSLKLYVESKPDEYRHCPTSDCPHVFRIRPPTDDFEHAEHCPGCLNKFCPSCFLEGGHDGITCAKAFENQQLALAEQAQVVEDWIRNLGGRSCPKCKMGLIKDGGCAHVQCLKCKVHICWTCGKAFEQVADESVYEHMRREHGSIGLIDWEMDDWHANNMVEWMEPPIPPLPSSGSSTGSPATRRPTTAVGRIAQSTQRRNKKSRRGGRHQRRARQIPEHSDDGLSEDEHDNFGGGQWDFDFADVNWESL